MIVEGEDPLLPREPELFDLKGLRVIEVEEIVTQEQLIITFDNGWQLQVSSSEWLTVEIKQGTARPTPTGASQETAAATTTTATAAIK